MPRMTRAAGQVPEVVLVTLLSIAVISVFFWANVLGLPTVPFGGGSLPLALCGGTVTLSLSPSTVAPGGWVTATIGGISNCGSFSVGVYKDACPPTGTNACGFGMISPGTGGQCSFASPTSSGSYNYVGCIDFNNDGVYTGAGEASSTQVVVVNNCGNGVINPGETCDDVNKANGDGCSSTCQVEQGWTCNGAPSVCIQLPPTPVLSSTGSGSGWAALSWTASAGASCYKVYRGNVAGVVTGFGSNQIISSPGAGGCNVGDPVGLMFNDTTPVNGNTYYYKVDAVTAAGLHSAGSNEVSATPQAAQQQGGNAPTITAVAPMNGATNVPNTTTITATFSAAMSTAATEGAFSTSPSTTGTFAWTLGNTKLTYTPGAQLDENTVYAITISTAAKDSNNNAMAAAYSWSFTTVAFGGPGAPEISEMPTPDVVQKVTGTAGQLKKFVNILNSDTTKITDFNITLKSKVTNAYVNITVVTELPGDLGLPDPPDTAYQYLRFDTTDPATIAKASMRFKVEKTWLEDNGLSAKMVKMRRYDSTIDDWMELTTAQVDEDDTYFYYLAQSPGLSYFEIGSSEAPPCGGTVTIDLPSKAEPSTDITAAVDGMSNCDGQSITVKLGSCASGVEACSATLTDGTKGECTFTTPDSNGAKTYSACIDLDADGKFTGAGESAGAAMTIQAIVQSCTDGTVYDECSVTKPKFCDNGDLIDQASQCGCPSGTQAEGESCAEIQTAPTSTVSQADASAAIQLANASITAAKAGKKDVSEAIALYNQAVEAFNSADYETSKLQADAAKTTADTATVTEKPPTELPVAPIAAAAVLIAAGIAAYVLKFGKKAGAAPSAAPAAPSAPRAPAPRAPRAPRKR